MALNLFSVMPILRPNFRALRAIGTDVNLTSTSEQRGSEFLILLALPDLIERVLLKVAKLMRGILIKTTRHYETIPREHA